MNLSELLGGTTNNAKPTTSSSSLPPLPPRQQTASSFPVPTGNFRPAPPPPVQKTSIPPTKQTPPANPSSTTPTKQAPPVNGSTSTGTTPNKTIIDTSSITNAIKQIGDAMVKSVTQNIKVPDITPMEKALEALTGTLTKLATVTNKCSDKIDEIFRKLNDGAEPNQDQEMEEEAKKTTKKRSAAATTASTTSNKKSKTKKEEVGVLQHGERIVEIPDQHKFGVVPKDNKGRRKYFTYTAEDEESRAKVYNDVLLFIEKEEGEQKQEVVTFEESMQHENGGIQTIQEEQEPDGNDLLNAEIGAGYDQETLEQEAQEQS